MFRLEQHYEMHSDQIYQFLYFITFDVQLSEDLMQETFIRAYETKHTYRGEANVLTWLRTIAKNIAYDHFKRKKSLRFYRLKKMMPKQPLHFQQNSLFLLKKRKDNYTKQLLV